MGVTTDDTAGTDIHDIGRNPPVIVIVTGPPCTGKTAIARQVADHFSLPLMGKDTFKEVLFDTVGWKDRSWSRRLSRASVEMLFGFMEAELRARRSCVVESNFKAEFDAARFLQLRERYTFEPVQIQCVADGQVLFERFKRRAEGDERHPGHCDHLNYAEFQETLLEGRLESLDIGGRLIEIDTTDFNTIDYAAVYAEISQAFQETTQAKAESHRHQPAPGSSTQLSNRQGNPR
jgi:predicted kinase